ETVFWSCFSYETAESSAFVLTLSGHSRVNRAQHRPLTLCKLYVVFAIFHMCGLSISKMSLPNTAFYNLTRRLSISKMMQSRTRHRRHRVNADACTGVSKHVGILFISFVFTSTQRSQH
ncbi:unnamed protein product, partial [Ectocarpus sp. 8 AP-2014]